MSQPGITEIGKYRIVEQVGEGAMGVVYRATDPVLNRTVAIKVMCDAVARDDDLRGRFLREAQAAGSLQHPNVITIYDFGETDGHLFIAMEFVEGQDLETLAARHIPLPLIDKLDIVIDVLSGLAFAHKRGIVHRDIKPANIRIDDEGRARVMDFGIAHLSASSMTRTGIMVGTPAYMAPEQIVGTPVSPATDLFSVGTVLYELLTGSKPFQAESIQSIMYQIVSQPAPPLNAAKLGIPTALDSILSRAMAKDAGDRYPSALEMANALTAVRASLDRNPSGSKTVSLRSAIDMGLTAERAAKQRTATRRGALIGISAATAIVLASLGIFALRNKPAAAPQLAAGVTAINSAAETPSKTNPTNSAASTVAATKRDSATVPSPTQQAAPKAATKTEAKGASTQEVLLVRALQRTALESRRRAVEAGATADQLRPGDDNNRAAESLVNAGKVSEAAVKLNDATTAWSAAERDARLAATASAAAAAAATRTKTAVDPPKELPPTPASSAVAPPQVAPIKPAAPVANPSAEIESAVAAYARAIESREIAEVRRAYPGITAAQASGFEQFFATVRSLRAAFSVSSLDINGTTAEGKLAGTYDYVTNAGKSERQAVTFQATFRHDANGWKLASVR